MDGYDLEEHALHMNEQPRIQAFNHHSTGRFHENHASGNMSDVFLDESGMRIRQRTSKIFTEPPMYSEDKTKKRQRVILSVAIFGAFLFLGIVVANARWQASKSSGDNTVVVVNNNGTTATIPEVEVVEGEITLGQAEADEELKEEMGEDYGDNTDDAEIALEEEIEAIAAEEEEVIEAELEANGQESKDLLAEEAEKLEELEAAVEQEEEILEQMDAAETEEEIDLLNEEAEVVELMEDNLGGQVELLDEAARESMTPGERAELEAEVEQLEMQQDNLENQLEADIKQEDELSDAEEEEEGEETP